MIQANDRTNELLAEIQDMHQRTIETEEQIEADTIAPGPSPIKTTPSRSHALYVSEGFISVWQYHADISTPEGDWQFVERLDRENGPKLDLEYAIVMPPDGDGYRY